MNLTSVFSALQISGIFKYLDQDEKDFLTKKEISELYEKQINLKKLTNYVRKLKPEKKRTVIEDEEAKTDRMT